MKKYLNNYLNDGVSYYNIKIGFKKPGPNDPPI